MPPATSPNQRAPVDAGASTANASARESDAPPPDLRPLALPAAMNRLARAHGLGVEASEKALVAEYGARPKPESIKALGEELGADFVIEKKKVAALTAADLPVLALVAGGGAVIVRAREEGRVILEGAEGAITLSAEAAESALATAIIRLRLNDRSADRMTAPGQASAGRPAGDEGRSGLLMRLAGLVWRRNRPEFVQLLAASLLCNLFMIALPLYIMSVYDRVIPHSAVESLVTLTVGVAIVFAADAALRFVRLKFTDAIGLRIARTLQLRLYRKLLFVKLARRPKSAAGLTNVQGELEALCLLMPEFIVSLIADSLLAVAVIALIAWIGGAVVIAPIAGLIAVAAVVFSGAWSSQRYAERASAIKSAASGRISETFDALTAVKAAGAEHQLLSQIEKIYDVGGLINHETRQRLLFSGHAAGVIIQATVAATLFLGAMRIDSGLMTIGSLAAATILVGRGVTPVARLLDQFCRLWTLKRLLDGAFDLVTAEEDEGGERDGAEGRVFTGAFRLRRVSYTHPSSEVEALKDVSLDIAPGEKIGVIGKNGGGKSTLLHLLPRLYTPTEGAFLIDGYDARQYSARRLRQEIAFTPQETVLFNGTLKENILLGVETVDIEDFERAVKLSGVMRFASRHPKGFSMPVGPRGEFLSAGERQAVGVARALVRPKPALIMDEPTSLMDHTAEAGLIDALKPFVADRTLIVSTHRLRLLELVDRLVVLDAGRIVQDGPKSEVLAALSGQPALKASA